MRKPICNTTLGVTVTGMICCAIGCGKKPDQLDQSWMAPVAVAASSAGLAGWFYLDKCDAGIIGLKPQRGGPPQCVLLNKGASSWSEAVLTSVPPDFPPYAAIDPQSTRILLADGYAENEQLVMKALMGTTANLGGLGDVTKKQWITAKKSLIGETGSDVRMTFPGMREGLGLGPGILSGPLAFIPYAFHGRTFFGNSSSNGPFANGVFYSTDAGKTWQMEKIADFESLAPEMCRTKGHYYYVGIRYPIIGHGVWASRKPVSGSGWEEPGKVAESFANVYGRFAVAGEGDTAHICWMDRRHNKMRFNLTGPPIENNDIYYRRRKDSDPEWGKELHLSKGLLYCYAPTIAAEGDNVVVAWAGIRTADKSHTYMDPNDIYYVTSKDGGQTWTKPLKVTDGAKDGLAAGMPQVALLGGTIHLLYTQGKQAAAKELSPGLTRSGGEPWPIYHTHRQFPK